MPVIRVSNFQGNSISNEDLRYVSKEIAESNQNVYLKEHDIIIATVGSWPNNPASVVGRTISVPSWANNTLMNQNSVIIRTQSKSIVDQKFIYYQLQTDEFSHHLISKAQGSANQASITLDAIFSYKIYWPESIFRRAIAETLGALDDRIALLRKTNTTLEAIAQALFKSWFVDFDPVHAKQQGREPEGMDEATAALFPREFEESELGLVPKGWSVGSLKEFCTLTSGKRPVVRSDNQTNEASIPLYGGAGIMGFTSEALFQETKILTGRVGTLGNVHLVNPPFWASDNVLVLTPINKRNLLFCLHWVSGIDVHALNRGSTQPLLTQKDLGNQTSVLPTEDLLDLFTEVTGSVYAKIEDNRNRIVTLITIRDTLLPRLISGQLRLPEAETMLEETCA